MSDCIKIFNNMGVNLFKIKKWTKMLRGNSVYHVNQNEGKYYSKTEVKGYYNNLTDKVLLAFLYDIINRSIYTILSSLSFGINIIGNATNAPNDK